MPDDFTFDPETVRIREGQTVRWRNTSAVNHTVTAYEDELPAGASYFASGGFSTERAARNSLDGGLIAPGETYDHEFNVAGTYPYYCIPHEGSGMVGTVEVQ